MLDKFDAQNKIDEQGNPAGGHAIGIGMQIEWQNGPLGRDCCNRPSGQGTHAPECDGISTRKNPNGAFVETLLAVILQRIRFYQTVSGGKFCCSENIKAIAGIEDALYWLEKRTLSREVRGVEGTHNG